MTDAPERHSDGPAREASEVLAEIVEAGGVANVRFDKTGARGWLFGSTQSPDPMPFVYSSPIGPQENFDRTHCGLPQWECFGMLCRTAYQPKMTPRS